MGLIVWVLYFYLLYPPLESSLKKPGGSHFLSQVTKVSYFFLHGKVRFCAFLRNFEWMNEKAVFFFPGCVFFFRPKIWMNEWLVNFSRKKKKHKKTNQNSGKKKTQPTFIKKNRNPSKTRMNDQWTFPGKKKTRLYFFFPGFFRFAEK